MTGRLHTGTVTVREVGRERAAAVLSVVHASVGTQAAPDASSTATVESLESVARTLDEHGGLLALVGDDPVGALLFEADEHLLGVRLLAVHPDGLGMGVSGAMIGTAERVAQERGRSGLRPTARTEPPETVRLWERLGYGQVDGALSGTEMGKVLPVDRVVESADAARDLGAMLAGVLRCGDVVILSGGLGAGKTTFTQGIGTGLQVRGAVTSPTFVISRVHPSLVGGPALVHVDAYRLGGVAELDDLDLEVSLDEAVTVVEWGEGVAEGLAQARLEVTITRPWGGDPFEDPLGGNARRFRFVPVGGRWIRARLREVLA